MLLIGFFTLWSIVGGIFGIIPILCTCKSCGAIGQSEGLEFVNPIFIYKHNRVNWFGAIVVSIVYGFICPAATVGYWFYKLCTVGRK